MMGWRRGIAAAMLGTALLSIEPAGAQQCVNDYERLLVTLRHQAGECAKHDKLMTALTDAAGFEKYGEGSPKAARPPGRPGHVGIDTGTFNRNSLHDFRFYLPNRADPRWWRDGDSIVFNCGTPLSPDPMPQNEAFLECARVYLCAAATTSCGIDTARRTGSRDCKGITRQCMASYPIPQGTMGPVVAAPAPPPPPGAGPGTSVPRTPPPPPSPVASLSPACKAQLNQFLAAADRGDSVAAAAAYEGLRGTCDAAMRQLAQAADVTLPERQMGALSRRWSAARPARIAAPRPARPTRWRAPPPTPSTSTR
ncbi:MAG TPA: hypothetical protein VEC60_14350 [Reyranella sp.]|nr:hypothetical protein [Reyranella sp.]